MSTDDYSFSEIEGGYRIGTLDPSTSCNWKPTGYKAYETNKTPVSPSKYNGKDILEVGRCAYAYIDITKVTILEPVQTIQCYAFSTCRSLTEVYLPSTILSIVSYAFCDCTSLSLLNFCRYEAVTCGTGVFNKVPSSLVIKVPKTSKISQLGDFSTHKVLDSDCIFRKRGCTCEQKVRSFNLFVI